MVSQTLKDAKNLLMYRSLAVPLVSESRVAKEVEVDESQAENQQSSVLFWSLLNSINNRKKQTARFILFHISLQFNS